MAYTKALHVSANTLSPWSPEQNRPKGAAWRERDTALEVFQQFLTSLMEREKSGSMKVL